MALPQPEPVNFSRAETIAQLRLGPSASKEADDCLMARAADLLAAQSGKAVTREALAEAAEKVARGKTYDNAFYAIADAFLDLTAPAQSDDEKLRAENARLVSALEWALDQATDSDHPHYPERVLPRTAYAAWHFPYLVHGTPMGGGVGHANFQTALEAVEGAREQEKRP